MIPPHRVLALAGAYGRVGSVFLVDGSLKHWEISRKAAKSAENAASITEYWIRDLRPEVVVTENVGTESRKSERTRAIIEATERAAKRQKVLSMSVLRPREYKNKYEEAAALAGRYPELVPWLPKKRRFFDPEPKNMVLFEALALADAARRSGAIGLAPAMG